MGRCHPLELMCGQVAGLPSRALVPIPACAPLGLFGVANLDILALRLQVPEE